MERLNLSRLPSLEEQGSLIAEIMKTRFDKDQIWYVVNKSWMDAFRRFVGLDKLERYEHPKYPGRINNKALFENSSFRIRSGLIEDLHFTLVPECAWNLLVSWYGVARGQQLISRKTIECDSIGKQYKVEIYSLRLNFCYNFDFAKTVAVLKFSATDLMDQVAKEMRIIFKIPKSFDVRLWGLSSFGKFELLPLHISLQDIPLVENQYIVIESKSPDQQWELLMTSSDKTVTERTDSPNSPAEIQGFHLTPYKNTTKPGLCGLVNIGNTCYINSIVQCLSHCPPVTYYFLNNLYMLDINCDNTQGSYGKVTESFGNLINRMWSLNNEAFVPVKFVIKVGQFSSEFAKGGQHDTLQFMAFLLKILHEDLKKISSNPLIPVTLPTDLPDNEIADAVWSNFKSGNDSFIVDNFYGLQKTTVICSNCDKISSVFEPFVFLSLSLPMERERELQVRYVPFNQTEVITDYIVSVPCDGSVHDLFLEMMKFIVVPTQRMILSEVVGNHCHYFFSSDDKLSSIKNNCTLMLFDTPVEITNYGIGESQIIMPVILWEVSGEDTLEDNSKLFGNPFLIFVPSTPVTYEELHNLIMARMTRYIKRSSTVSCTSHGTCNAEAMKMEMIPVKLFVVNCQDYTDAQEVPNTGSLITFKEHLNHKTIAVQWTSETRSLWFEESIPLCCDTTDCNSDKKLSLEDCMSSFNTIQKLGIGNTWLCFCCNKQTYASIKYDLWDLPRVLVFQLKRAVCYDGNPVKNDVFVEFPLKNLHMEKFVIKPGQKPVLYDLFAVCNHYGEVNYGHYTTFVRHNDDGMWYCINDNVVMAHEESKVITNAAYLLFYLRRGEVVFKLTTPSSSASSSPKTLFSSVDEVASGRMQMSPDSLDHGSVDTELESNGETEVEKMK